MKINTYTVVDPGGKVETIRVPAIFSPFVVAEQIPHHSVFWHIKGKDAVLAYCGSRTQTRLVKGPDGVVFVGRATLNGPMDTHYVPRAPKTDSEALQLWREWVNAESVRQEEEVVF